MKRYLDFFEPGTRGSIQKPLAHAFDRGARKALVIGTEACDRALTDTLRKMGFSWGEKQLTKFRASDIAAADLVLVPDGNGVDVSQVLHDCMGANAAVIAPVTEHHFSKRTVFLMSIPKAGTHMVIRLFDLMGLARSPDRAPRPGTWSTPVGYEYHAPCRELLAGDWFDPLGRQLLFRSPAIFVYRHPLDIVVSELDWFVRPEHAFSGYLNCCADESEQLERLIADRSVMGTIRDRINRYTGWMNFGNVIPVSYEELVGKRGGGSDAEKLNAIWALQLKLHIPGSPQEYGEHLYDPTSATFSKGKIGRHVERFEKRHFTLLNSLPQDFMQALGYRRGSKLSSKVMALRKRPLVVKELPQDLLYRPRLVREGMMGWNIIEVAGKYFPVRQGEQVMSTKDAIAVSAGQDGFMALSDAMDAVVHSSVVAAAATTKPIEAPSGLIVEGHCGFNIVCHGGRWYGFAQSAGPIDIDSLDASALDDMKSNDLCVTGGNAAEIKMEILHLALQSSERRDAELTALLRTAGDLLNSLDQRVQSNDGSMRKLADRLDDVVSGVRADGLAVEGYLGFNIVCHGGGWFGFSQATGSLDINGLDESTLRDMRGRGELVTGENCADVKTEILRLVNQSKELRDAELAAKLGAAEAVLNALDQRIESGNRELAARLQTAEADLQALDQRLGSGDSRLAARLQTAEAVLRELDQRMEFGDSQLSAKVAAAETLLNTLNLRIESGDASLREIAGRVEAIVASSRHDDGLVVEGYFGFNVVHSRGRWYGFDQAAGPLDVGSLDTATLAGMKSNGVCVMGENCADVKAEILRSVLQSRKREYWGLAAKLKAARTAFSNRGHPPTGRP